MKITNRSHGRSGISRMELAVVIFAICALVLGLLCAATFWKRGSDRSATIMNIRNCQQAMRGHQGMRNLNTGGPFTRRDLEQYMNFPQDIRVLEGKIEFKPGSKVSSISSDPALNGDHLWLKVNAPGTMDYVGRYGFKDIAEVTGW